MPSQPVSFTERVSAHVERSEALLDEIRRATAYLRNKKKYAFWKLEEVTGLHKNSLLRLSDLDWHPKPETLRALALLVERAQALRRGEVFTFADRRGPGRPKVDETPEPVPEPVPSRPRRRRKPSISMVPDAAPAPHDAPPPSPPRRVTTVQAAMA